MNVEIGAEATQFPEKEYINGIAYAVHRHVGAPFNPLVPGHQVVSTVQYTNMRYPVF